MTPRDRATIIGFGAVLLWALLALFTVGSAPVPPFLLTALSFTIGGMLGLVWCLATGTTGRLRGIGWQAYTFGTAGLFGYHAFYFSALRLAPPAQAGLIAYLWPLFIVLLSGLLPGERLLARHVVGALVAFGGAVLIVGQGGGIDGKTEGAALGLGFAFLCALTWAVYSVGLRRFAHVPSEAVAISCLATAALSVAAHLIWEETLWPSGALGWLSVLGLGLGPVGAAFFVWDVGMKRGDIQMLGVASYAAPLLSTALLVVTGFAIPTWSLALAAILIAAGAALASGANRRQG